MTDQQLDQIAKMLRAQLKGQGHLWWIGGYVYGMTSEGAPFVILYPASERLTEKVVRVYPHDFKKLPGFIPTDNLDAGDTEANPNKTQAKKAGIYHECPLFEIVTFDGKDTQMGKERRFGDVLRVTGGVRNEQPADQEPQARPAAKPGPLPDDEQVIRDDKTAFMRIASAKLKMSTKEIQEHMRSLGYNGIPGHPVTRLEAYQKLKLVVEPAEKPAQDDWLGDTTTAHNGAYEEK